MSIHVKVRETNVSFLVLIFTNPIMLLNILKFFETEFTNFLNVANSDCLMDYYKK